MIKGTHHLNKYLIVKLERAGEAWQVLVCSKVSMYANNWYFDRASALKFFKSITKPNEYRPLAWYSSHHSKVTRYDMTAVRVPCISGSSKIIIHHEGFALKGSNHA